MKRKIAASLLSAGLGLLPLDSGYALESPAPSTPDASSAAPAASSLTGLLDALAAADAALAQKARDFQGIVDAEVAAKRLPAVSAEPLKMAAQMIGAPAMGDPRTILGSVRLPAENAAAAKGIKDLQHDALAWEIKCEELTSQATVEIRRRIYQTAFGAQKAADVAPLLLVLKRFEEEAGAHPKMGEMNTESANYAQAIRFLQTISATLEAQSQGNLSEVTEDIREVSAAANSASFINLEDVQDLRVHLEAKQEIAMENARHELESAMASWKSPEEISAAFHAFEKASLSCFDIPFLSPGYVLNLYRKAVEVEISLARNAPDDGMLAKVNEVSNALTSSLSWPVAERCEKLRRFLPHLQRAVASGAPAQVPFTEEALRTKLQSVKTRADLEKLRLDLELSLEQAGGPARGAAETVWIALGQISGSDWASGLSRLEGFAADAPEFADALTDLSERLERSWLSERLKAPELMSPPLAGAPSDLALDSLCGKLADEGQWPRLLTVLRKRSALEFSAHGRRSHEESIIGVEAYLAGQNLELAGQWEDAAAAYKLAIERAAAYSPAKEAAERLKTLKREHAEAFASPAHGQTSAAQ